MRGKTDLKTLKDLEIIAWEIRKEGKFKYLGTDDYEHESLSDKEFKEAEKSKLVRLKDVEVLLKKQSENMKTKEEAINFIKAKMEECKDLNLGLGEIGSASWKKDQKDLTGYEWRVIGYTSALSWAFEIKPEELGK